MPNELNLGTAKAEAKGRPGKQGPATVQLVVTAKAEGVKRE